MSNDQGNETNHRLVVVITGASRAGGIGLAIGERFARDGHDIVLSDIGHDLESFPDYEVPPPDALDLAVDSLAGVGGGRVIGRRCDVTVAAEVDALVQDAIDEFGRVDVFVNNAGVSLGLKPTIEITDDEWDRNIGVMATGTFYGTRAAGRHMTERGSGCIVNISSQAGKTGWPLLSAYSAAKFAIIGLTQSAALELGPQGIRVNAVCPGTVDTPLLDIDGGPMDVFTQKSGATREEARRRQRRSIPLRRFATPADIADTVFFLASPAASFITGESINVTGGEEVH